MNIDYNKLPESWQFRHLGEVAEIIAGQSLPSASYNNKKGVAMLSGILRSQTAIKMSILKIIRAIRIK
ncbi:MAG: hypothetical protein WCA84_14820 [Ignavibacteriaceae bacterium]